MTPTEYFPDNLEENVNVKIEKPRFAMARDLSILHSSVLKMRPKICKIAWDIFINLGKLQVVTVFPAMYDYPYWKNCQETFWHTLISFQAFPFK